MSALGEECERDLGGWHPVCLHGEACLPSWRQGKWSLGREVTQIRPTE